MVWVIPNPRLVWVKNELVVDAFVIDAVDVD